MLSVWTFETVGWRGQPRWGCAVRDVDGRIVWASWRTYPTERAARSAARDRLNTP